MSRRRKGSGFKDDSGVGSQKKVRFNLGGYQSYSGRNIRVNRAQEAPKSKLSKFLEEGKSNEVETDING